MELETGKLYRFKFWVNLFVYDGYAFGHSKTSRKIDKDSIAMILPTIETVDDYECRAILINDGMYWLRFKNFTANNILARVKT